MRGRPRIPIAVVLTSFDRGGTERQMTELIARLDPEQFDVHAACFRREGPWVQRVESVASSVREFRLRSFRSPTTLVQALAFARWCRTKRIAVVHACDIYANIFALPAAALARVPMRIASRRGIVSPTGDGGLLRLQALAYRWAHRVIANSAAAAEAVARDGVPADRIAVIPNGIDLRVFPPAPQRHPRRVVTTVANLRGGKGHDVLLRAAADVLRAHPDALFQLVGDGPLRGELEGTVEALGIGQRVRFLGHRDDVVAILRQSDLFAFPSLMEAFPNAVMEAMAVGLPVVASRVGGIPELIEDGHNGLLVPPNDAASLARAISELLGDAAAADRLAIAARATVDERYSFERMTREFEATYRGELSSTLPIDAAPRPWANVFPRV